MTSSPQRWQGTRQRWSHLLILAAAAVLTCSIYSSTLHNPFIYDDQHIIQNNQYLRSTGNLLLFFKGHISTSGFLGHTRPMPMISFYLNHALDGLNPRGYRAVNIGLHMLCSLLVFFLVRRLILGYSRCYRQDARDCDPTIIAAMAAGIFLIHPLNSMAMLMVWKRTTLLASLCYLLAVLAFLRLRGVGAPPPGGWRRRFLLAASIPVLYALALGSKESAITLPAALLVLDLWPRPGSAGGQGPPPLWSRLLLHVFTWSAAGIWWLFFFPSLIAGRASLDRISYLWVQAKAIWFYLYLVLDPFLLAASYDLRFSGLGDPLALAGGAAILALLVGAVALCRRYPLATLAVLWALITLSPTSSVLPGPLLVDEDRTYLPFIMVWLGLGWGLVWCWRRSRATRWASSLAALALVLVSLMSAVTRVITWQDDIWLWQDALKKYPGSAMAKMNLCNAMQRLPGRAHETLAFCRKALADLPGTPVLAEGVARALVSLGQLDEALEVTKRAMAQRPGIPSLLKLAGFLAWNIGDHLAAVSYYQQVLQITPGDMESILSLAKNYQALGRLDDVRMLLDKIEGQPVSGLQARMTLAQLNVALGRRARAAEILRDLAIRFPDRAWPLLEQAQMALEAGQTGPARQLLQQARSRAVLQPVQQVKLARLLLRSGDPAQAITVLQHLDADYRRSPQARLLLGASLLAQGETARACETYGQIPMDADRQDPLLAKLTQACSSSP